jgi:hypothetical protein
VGYSQHDEVASVQRADHVRHTAPAIARKRHRIAGIFHRDELVLPPGSAGVVLVADLRAGGRSVYVARFWIAKRLLAGGRGTRLKLVGSVLQFPGFAR